MGHQSAQDLAHRMPAWWGVKDAASYGGTPGGVAACFMEAKPGEVSAKSSDAHVLTLAIRGEPRHVLLYDDRVYYEGAVPDYSLNIVPAGIAPSAFIREPLSVLHVYLPHQLMYDMATEAGWSETSAALEIRNPNFAPDDHLRQLCCLYADALRSVDRDRLYMEPLGRAIAGRVLSAWSSLGARSLSRLKGGLSPAQMRMCCEVLAAKLEEDIGLGTVAQLVGVSQEHLCRAFSHSLGVSPSQWRLNLRMERAKELLGRREMSVMQVAVECGFSTHPGFSTAFKRHVGLSPTQYRELHS